MIKISLDIFIFIKTLFKEPALKT